MVVVVVERRHPEVVVVENRHLEMTIAGDRHPELVSEEVGHTKTYEPPF